MFETEGYVEAMHPVLLANLLDALEEVYSDWKNAPETKFGMHKYAKKDLLKLLEYKLDRM